MPGKQSVSSPVVKASIKIGEGAFVGRLTLLTSEGVAVMSTDADVPLSILGPRVLGRVVREELAEIFRGLSEAPSREQWETTPINVDLTQDESSALYDELSAGTFSPPSDVPGWALPILEDAEESEVPPTWIFCCGSFVAFLTLDTVSGGEDSDMDHADDSAGFFTFIAKEDIASDINIGGRASVNVLLDNEVDVALIHEYDDGSRVVIESDAPAHDHYTLALAQAALSVESSIEAPTATADPPPTGQSAVAEPTTPTTADVSFGRIISYCAVSANYACVSVETARGRFWVPVGVAVQAPSPSVERADVAAADRGSDSEPKFGQHGGDFYVNRGGERLHISTALKILQRWVDQVSHNRGERFRSKKVTAKDGDFVPLAFYAVKILTPQLNGFVYTVACLDKLVRVAEGSSVVHVDSASYDAANLEGQFNLYKLHDDGTYRRSSIQTKQEKLANSRVIMKVDFELSDEFNGGKLSDHSKAELLAGSLVDTTQAKKLTEEKLAVPRKRGSGNSAQSLSLSGSCQLSRRDSRLQRASVGDLLISIDGHCTEGGGMAARSLLRRALAREELTGGHVELLFWQPPADWAPFVLVPDNGDATPQGDSPVTGDGGRAPELSETEMLSLARVTKRLSGGDSKSNLERICAALSLTRTGSDLKKKRRIEAELRRRCFPGFDGWTPTHDDIRSFFAGGAEGFYKKYEQTVHSVAAAERMLRELPSPPADGT